MSDSKQAFREFCASGTFVPVYLRDYYLDAACGERWDVILVESKGEVKGFFVYEKVKKKGLTLLKTPLTTPFGGLWYNYPPDQKYASKVSFEIEVAKEIISRLPDFNYLNIRFAPDFDNWLPFYWDGFEQTTLYTYVITDLSDLDRVQADMKSNIRGKIRKARKQVEVDHDENPELFYEMNLKSFQRQNISIPYSKDFFLRVDKALKEKNNRKMFFARDAEGNIHSALYLVYDERKAYVHLAGEDPEYRNSGAGSLNIWAAIEYTANELKLNEFDFEGSMIEPIEMNRRAYGAKQLQYFRLRKYKPGVLKFRELFE